MQLEAWMVLITLVTISWCAVGGLWLGAKLVWTLARLAFGR